MSFGYLEPAIVAIWPEGHLWLDQVSKSKGNNHQDLLKIIQFRKKLKNNLQTDILGKNNTFSWQKKIIFVICIFELYLLVLSKSADDWALGNIWERKTILDYFAIIMISSSLAYFLTTRPAKLTRFSFLYFFIV